MKIIALGDTHGRKKWERIVMDEEFDKIVFLGDYFDSREGINPINQIENFNKILNFKRDYPDKVVLLLGNHDYHYLPYVNEHYSGYNQRFAGDIKYLIDNAQAEGLVQVCYQAEKYLFSHAGFTKTWLLRQGINTFFIEDRVNNLFHQKPKVFGFTPGSNRCDYGNDITQSPLWVRPPSLLKDKPESYCQIVGHSVYGNIEQIDNIAFIDVLGTSGEYLSITEKLISPVQRTYTD
jgi:hypothetical protein